MARSIPMPIDTAAIVAALFNAAPNRFDTGWPELAAGVGALGLVLLRRRHPLLLLVIALAWTATHVAALQRPTPTLFATIVLLITASIRLERSAAIAVGAVIGASLYVFVLVGNDAEYGDARAVIGLAWSA